MFEILDELQGYEALDIVTDVTEISYMCNGNQWANYQAKVQYPAKNTSNITLLESKFGFSFSFCKNERLIQYWRRDHPKNWEGYTLAEQLLQSIANSLQIKLGKKHIENPEWQKAAESSIRIHQKKRRLMVYVILYTEPRILRKGDLRRYSSDIRAQIIKFFEQKNITLK